MSLGRRIWQVGRTLTAAGLLVVQALGADAAMAQDGSRVTSVQVRGLSTIAEETCLARVQTRPGMTYSDQITSEDIRRLYALGYFTDVRVETEPHEDGVAVVFLVKEKPTIGEIQLEGELRMAKSKVTQLLGLKKGDLYDPRKLKDGIDQVKAEYRRKGYSRAEVTSSTKDDPSANTTTLVLVVDPGPRMRVKDVLVEAQDQDAAVVAAGDLR
jgi:outer membrane protein insertion porin family